MSDIITFYSFKQFKDYVTIVAGVEQYLEDGGTNPHWNEIYETIERDTKFNYKWVNGEYVWDEAYYEPLEGDIMVSVGKTATVSSANTTSSVGSIAQTQNNSGGGGVKTAPVTKSVITDNQGGTDITQNGTGLKTFGVDSIGSIMNVVTGIAQAFGLANLAINAQNSHIWRDLVNNVFDGDLSADATIDEIKNILSTKTHKMVVLSNNEPQIVVSKNICERLYDFFAVHMVATGGSEEMSLYIPALIFALCVYGMVDPSQEYGWQYYRYYKPLNTTAPNTGVVYFDLGNISDDLFKIYMTDFCATILGSGFTLAEENIISLINSCNGLTQAISDRLESSGLSMDGMNRVAVRCYMSRSGPPPKTTPVSPSEIRITFDVYEDKRLIVDETLDDRKRVRCYQNVDVHSKYIKRGRDGSRDEDYAYWFNVPRASETYDNMYGKFVSGDLTFPANVRTVNIYTPQNRKRIYFWKG